MFNAILFALFSPDGLAFMRYLNDYRTYYKNTGSLF